MARFDVTALGEIMVRLSVPAGVRMETAQSLDVQPGGAEGNTVTALSRLGRDCAWCGALPSNSLGRLVANRLKLAQVDLSCVHWEPEGRAGLYFLEFAGPPRNSDVIYDRADSCAARLSPSDIPWDRLMDTRWFHVTGITPALSPNGLACTRRAFQEARDRGVAASLDVNYRAKMWSPAEARSVIEEFLPLTDILFCGKEDADTVLGITGSPEQVALRLSELVPSGTAVMSHGSDGIWGLRQGQEAFVPALPVEVVDRLGAGDAMAAGVLHGLLDDDFEQGLRYGALLAAMILTQHGDMLTAEQGEIEGLLQTGGGGLAR